VKLISQRDQHHEVNLPNRSVFLIFQHIIWVAMRPLNATNLKDECIDLARGLTLALYFEHFKKYISKLKFRIGFKYNTCQVLYYTPSV
jgi:hypothetical protein